MAAYGVKIILNKKDMKAIRKAVHSLVPEFSNTLRKNDGLLMESADTYIRDLRGDIIGQTFANRFPALNKQYEEFKKRYARNGKEWFWLLSESVFRNLKTWRTKQTGTVSTVLAGLPVNKAPTKSGSYKKDGVIKQTRGTWYASLIEQGYVGGKRPSIPRRPQFLYSWQISRAKIRTSFKIYFENACSRIWRP